MQNQTTLKFIEENYLLLLIVLLGAFLRLYDLGGESIWFDEAYTINISQYNPVGIVTEILSDNENHPPLYYSLMHYWIKLFGDSAFSVRFPSALFGVLSIVAIYKMAILLFNKNTALLSALILSTSVFLIELSQEARSYNLIALLSILSFYYFIKLLRRKNILLSFLYLLSTFLLISTHYYTVLILISQNIFFLTIYLVSRKNSEISLLRWIVVQLVILILYSPHFYLVIQASAVKEGLWSSTLDIIQLPGAFLTYSGSYPLFFLFFLLTLLTVFNLGVIQSVKSSNQYLKSFLFRSSESGLTYLETVYLLVLWVLMPIILSFLIWIYINPIYQVRYAIGGAAAFYILVAKGIDSFSNKKIIAAVAGIILVLSLLNARDYYTAVHKHEWREAAAYLESEAKPGDITFISPDYEVLSGHYHFNGEDFEVIQFSKESLFGLDKDNYDFWVIMSWHGKAGNEPLTYEPLKNYNVKSRKDFYKLKIYHYQN